jgi:hypothetical protein
MMINSPDDFVPVADGEQILREIRATWRNGEPDRIRGLLQQLPPADQAAICKVKDERGRSIPSLMAAWGRDDSTILGRFLTVFEGFGKGDQAAICKVVDVFSARTLPMAVMQYVKNPATGGRLFPMIEGIDPVGQLAI